MINNRILVKNEWLTVLDKVIANDLDDYPITKYLCKGEMDAIKLINPKDIEVVETP